MDKLAVAVVLVFVALAPALSAKEASKASPPKEGAKVQRIEKGKPVGPPVSLPDCRSCTVEKKGPNHYEVTVPDKVRRKAGTASAPR